MRAIYLIIYCAGFGLFLSSHAECETNQSLERFIIRDGEIPGYTTIKKPAYYNPGILWNYIDGGALPYLDYGVGDVVTYSGKVSPDNFEIVVDVYDMADSLDAFGIYSNERFPEYSYLEIGVEGYVTENALCFWKDRYYVKVFSKEDSPQTLAPIESIARAVDKRIPSGGSMPRYFSLFPGRYRLERTEAYIAKNVLGQDYLTNAYSVKYRRGDKEFQLYLLEAPDERTASEQFKQYRDFIREYGKPENKSAALGDEVFIGNESWYGLILFVRKGDFILVSVGLSDFELACAHLTSMLSGLSAM